jgi:quercetin dioxygenase-like cupin family protein
VTGFKEAGANDPYEFVYDNWLASEGVPVVDHHHILNLRKLELGEWKRRGGRVCFINYPTVGGQDRYSDCYIVEIPPGGELKPERHMFEMMFYVLDGSGTAQVWNHRGDEQTFEWAPASLCSIPLNAWYTIHNASGVKPARLLAMTNAPTVMHQFGDVDFVFKNEYDFISRFAGEADFFDGSGVQNGRFWESNMVANAKEFPLLDYKQRGAGGRQIRFRLAGNSLKAHISEFPVGTYKKAHKHGPGVHVIVLTGTGYTLMWQDGEQPKRYDWTDGSLVVPPNNWFHQHFNTGPEPARYLAISDLKLVKDQKTGIQLSQLSTKLGGGQIEYEDEDPSILAMFQEELARTGAECRMAPSLFAAK